MDWSYYIWLPADASHAFSVNGASCYLRRANATPALVYLGEPCASRGFTVDGVEVGGQLFGLGWCVDVRGTDAQVYLTSEDAHVVSGGTPEDPAHVRIDLYKPVGELVLSNLHAVAEGPVLSYVSDYAYDYDNGTVRVRGAGATLESTAQTPFSSTAAKKS